MAPGKLAEAKVNPLGAKALFDSAVATLDERVLASRGWVIHERTFPSLDLAFRNPARSDPDNRGERSPSGAGCGDSRR